MVFRKSGGEEHFVPKLETRRAVCVIRGLWRSSPGFSIPMNTVTEKKNFIYFFPLTPVSSLRGGVPAFQSPLSSAEPLPGGSAVAAGLTPARNKLSTFVGHGGRSVNSRSRPLPLRVSLFIH